MSKSHRLTAFALTLLTLSGVGMSCSFEHPGKRARDARGLNNPPQDREPPNNGQAQSVSLTVPELGASLTPDQKRQLAQLWETLLNLDLRDRSDEPGSYERLFGGSSIEDALRFIKVRVSRFAAVSNPELSRLLMPSQLKILERPAPERSPFFSVATASWISAKLSLLPDASSLRPTKNSRAGIIGVAQTDQDWVTLATALIGESRRSDCTGGFPSDAFEELKGVSVEDFPESLETRLRNHHGSELACGHLGAKPEDEDLGDLEFWQTQTIRFVFANKISNDCLNCSGSEKNTARELARLSASRLKAPKLISIELKSRLQSAKDEKELRESLLEVNSALMDQGRSGVPNLDHQEVTP